MNNRFTTILWWVTFLVATTVVAATIGVLAGWSLVPDQIATLINDGPVTLVILASFALGLTANSVNTLFVFGQRSHVSQGVEHISLPHKERLCGKGLLGIHIDRLYDAYGGDGGRQVSQESSLNAIRNQLFRREWMVRSTSGLLLTLGLIGTVLGLTDSLGGLSSTVRSVASAALSEKEANQAEATTPEYTGRASSDSTDVSAGLNRALGGMASAFITTLLGAVLGGVFLRILSGCTECLIEDLVDQIELITEARVIPVLSQSPEQLLRGQERALRKWASQIKAASLQEAERLAQVSEQLTVITRRFARLSKTIGEAESKLCNSRSHLAVLSRTGKLVARWDAMTSSLSLKAAVAAGCLLAIVGMVRLVVDFVG